MSIDELVELVCEFKHAGMGGETPVFADNDGGWRRILDVEVADRMPDGSPLPDGMEWMPVIILEETKQ